MGALLLGTMYVRLKMLISKIDFGPIDARHDFAPKKDQGVLLSKVFVNPFGIDIEEYKNGKKCFIFGIKGSGKSTILRIVRDKVRKSSGTELIYFSDLVENEDENHENNKVLSSEISGKNLNQDFWRSFFMVIIAKYIARYDLNLSSKKFLKYVYTQATGKEGSFQSIISTYPHLKNWAAKINNGLASVELEGDFKKSGNISFFYDSALALLKDINLRKPLYIFIDELEIRFSTSEKFDRDVRAAAALVKEVRSLNEFFRIEDIPIYVICAVRKEVSQRILGQDAAKIVRDLGYELSWQRPAWSAKDKNYYHPLFEIVLRRIYASKNPNQPSANSDNLISTEQEYFNFQNKGWSQKYILDLTTYRPRDLPILFANAKKFDGLKSSFSVDTFTRKLRKGYRDDLWSDFAEALRTEHSEAEVNLLKRIYFSLPTYFKINDIIRKSDDFSIDPESASLVERISINDWANHLKNLYELGALGWSEIIDDEERIHFHFRGDTDGLQLSKTNYIVKVLGLRD